MQTSPLLPLVIASLCALAYAEPIIRTHEAILARRESEAVRMHPRLEPQTSKAYSTRSNDADKPSDDGQEGKQKTSSTDKKKKSKGAKASDPNGDPKGAPNGDPKGAPKGGKGGKGSDPESDKALYEYCLDVSDAFYGGTPWLLFKAPQYDALNDTAVAQTGQNDCYSFLDKNYAKWNPKLGPWFDKDRKQPVNMEYTSIVRVPGTKDVYSGACEVFKLTSPHWYDNQTAQEYARYQQFPKATSVVTREFFKTIHADPQPTHGYCDKIYAEMEHQKGHP